MELTPFEAAVQDLAAQAGLRPVQLKRTRRAYNASAHASSTRNVIYTSPEIADAPADVQRWIAAHEVAHLAHRHRSVGALAWALVLGGAALSLAPALVSFFDPARIDTAVLASFPGGFAVIALAVAIVIRSSRRHEDEADDQAAAWGHPVTREVRDYLAISDHRQRRHWLDVHRTPDERERRHRDVMVGKRGPTCSPSPDQ